MYLFLIYHQEGRLLDVFFFFFTFFPYEVSLYQLPYLLIELLIV